MKLPVSHVLPIAALIFLTACVAGGTYPSPMPQAVTNGPAADYPVVTGDPFTIQGTTYTPVDKLNYDAVGYAAAGTQGGSGISAGHKTLPLPSYVEVTSLDTGRTILVRIERRGPMSNDLLLELSPGAVAQLGNAGVAKAPVRVRRVNPPEADRALLRGGRPAPERMETPKSLLAVLVRKLGQQDSVSVAAPDAGKAGLPETASLPLSAPAPVPSPPVPSPVARSKTATLPAPVSASDQVSPAKPSASSAFVVQVAVFSTQDRADRAAAILNGRVRPTGRFWRMQMGPFASKAQADTALAKARAAGYSDARIQRAD